MSIIFNDLNTIIQYPIYFNDIKTYINPGYIIINK